jgi:2-polyprenyl-6-methoxyphenol hydroxylase-like FAD-dependent oxidoreductase
LCISRFKLDALLAERFCDLQGELLTGSRWTQKEFGEGVVRASGRRTQVTGDEWRWFGIKAHAENVALGADLEMHLGPNWYVGLCRLPGDRVNVCGLFRRKHSDSDGPITAAERLRGAAGSLLSRRLEKARWDSESFCTVGGLSFRKERASHLKECCVGDALTMIPPVTGNGMSIAFESAELAISPLAGYARGEISWESARRIVAGVCDRTLARRLRWAGWLQEGILKTSGQRAILSLLIRSNLIWKCFFRITR